MIYNDWRYKLASTYEKLSELRSVTTAQANLINDDELKELAEKLNFALSALEETVSYVFEEGFSDLIYGYAVCKEDLPRMELEDLITIWQNSGKHIMDK